MKASSRIMIPPLLDQEGRPSHRRRNAALLGLVAMIFVVLVIYILLQGHAG